MSLRLFHSIWTTPQNQDRWGVERTTRNYVDLLCATISVACAKRNGCEIVLHTDNKGKERYGWIPYDEVHLTLENHNYDTAFWASGKVISQQYEPLEAIHIDTDVFVKTPRTVAMMQELRKYDLLVQHTEFNYERSYNRQSWRMFVNCIGGDRVPGMEDIFPINPCHAYCCGVVGFNSAELKELYIKGYEYLSQLLVNSPVFQEEKYNFCPDLLIEQAWLYSASQATGAHVKKVLANNDKSDAANSDYVHVINTAKYMPNTIVELERFLQYIDPSLFDGVKLRELTF